LKKLNNQTNFAHKSNFNLCAYAHVTLWLYFNIDFKIFKGGTLEEAIANKSFCGQNFTEECLLSWTFKLLNAIDYLHNELKIIHRDIKPG
jgi:serine/threonine protein kinase